MFCQCGGSQVADQAKKCVAWVTSGQTIRLCRPLGLLPGFSRNPWCMETPAFATFEVVLKVLSREKVEWPTEVLRGRKSSGHEIALLLMVFPEESIAQPGEPRYLVTPTPFDME